MQNLKQLLYSLTCEKNNEKDVIESEKEKNAPDEKFNFIITEINKLSTRIDKMEDKTNSILEQVDNYLNNCVPLNKENLRGLDAETIKKILHKKPIEKSANYYMRKAILLGMLIQLSFCSILLNQNRNSHKTLDTSNCEDSLKQDVLPYPKKISQSKIKDFDFYNRKDEAYSLEDSLNLALSLGNHFENPGSIPYYTSIYDTVPKGFSSKSGIIVSYYAFQQDGDVIKYITSLKSSQQIKEFISNHTDECQDYIWKVALYTGENEEVIQNMIKNHQVIPYEYFSYFTDYDILTFLENQTSFKHSIKR